MIIFLLRHGDALDSPTLEDSERPLSAFGGRQASATGTYLVEKHSEISLIYCSPLLRARQTAEAVQISLRKVPIQITDSLRSSSDPREIIQELPRAQRQTVLLVGHEPHLSRTISLLLWGDTLSRVDMKKCSLACVSIPDPPEAGRGVLKWLVESSQMLKG